MKRFALIAIGGLLLAGGAQAREVAYCDSGFDIQKVSGDKAVCAKTEKFWDDVGSRACPPGTAYVAGKTEASDGGDLCYETVSGKQMSSLPALPCGIGIANGHIGANGIGAVGLEENVKRRGSIFGQEFLRKVQCKNIL